MNSLNSHQNQSATLAIVESIAKQEGIDSVDLRPPLAEFVDTEALNRVVESLDGDGSIRFSYVEYEITVSSDGTVTVTEN